MKKTVIAFLLTSGAMAAAHAVDLRDTAVAASSGVLHVVDAVLMPN